MANCVGMPAAMSMTERLLPQRLVVQNDAADELLLALGGKQHVAVGAAILLSGLQLDAVEALLDGAARLVGGKNTLALGYHRTCNCFQLLIIHTLSSLVVLKRRWGGYLLKFGVA